MIMQSNSSLKCSIESCHLEFEFRHLISQYRDKSLKPTTTKILDLLVNEKKNGIVPKVLGNFQVENVLTICNSSPPFWNDDQVEYVLISFSKLFCFSNKWQMASANVTFFFFFCLPGIFAYHLGKPLTKRFHRENSKQPEYPKCMRIEFHVPSNVLGITVFWQYRCVHPQFSNKGANFDS